ncbi:hypothetical protein [Microlunatus sagamiharensis]|uniref:hypothetical protein n=1 Tax=Microlunatus sagamiharensis TaxID=546874 RepID=UPI0012FD0111|nr:hypothetical protein [Microlunatus sagamiharensis]
MIVVRRGWWLYDGLVELPVDVVGLTYDHDFAVFEEDGTLEPDDKPLEPDADGLIYYVRFRRAGELTAPWSFDWAGTPDLTAAMRIAQDLAPTPIRWE